MKSLLYLSLFLLLFTACQAQTNQPNHHVGGPCEGCEAVLEYGNKKLGSTATIPGYEQNEPKLKITGTVYQKDGTTPASNVTLYFYQTNRQGLYVSDDHAQGWAKRHGQHRTWIKTGSDGRYTLYTFRPAAYPNGREAEHIHITVKEPDINEYYIDVYTFDDDPLLTTAARKKMEKRGGSGVIQTQMKNGIFTANRDIILGRNIPDYEKE